MTHSLAWERGTLVVGHFCDYPKNAGTFAGRIEDVIAIGEPLVRAMAGLQPLRTGCGISAVRVTPRGTTQPCVYWPGLGEPLSDLISAGPEILNSAPF